MTVNLKQCWPAVFPPAQLVFGVARGCVQGLHELTELSASDVKSFCTYFVSPYWTIFADFIPYPPIPLGRISWCPLTGLSCIFLKQSSTVGLYCASTVLPLSR